MNSPNKKALRAVAATGFLAACIFGACLPPDSVEYDNPLDPTTALGFLAGAHIATGSVTVAQTLPGQVRLTFPSARPTLSGGTLSYHAYISEGDNIRTVAQAFANGTSATTSGTIAPTFADGVATYTFGRALRPGTTYFVNVVVTDVSGRRAAYTAAPFTTDSVVLLFSAGSGSPGQTIFTNGRTSVDAACTTAAASHIGLDTSRMRALISVSATDEIRDMPGNYSVPTSVPVHVQGGSLRLANDWADLLDGSVATTLQNAGFTQFFGNWWSGSNADGSLNAANCNGFTDNSGGNTGMRGNLSGGTSNWITSGTGDCNSSDMIICATW